MGLYTLESVINMQRETDANLKLVVGGSVSITGALLEQAVNLLNLFFGIGINLGSSLRHIKDKRVCSY